MLVEEPIPAQQEPSTIVNWQGNKEILIRFGIISWGGTTNTIFILRQLHGKYLIIWFEDMEKGFDWAPMCMVSFEETKRKNSVVVG